MNVFLWVLQIVLALHTAVGAIWKFFNTEQAAALQAIPHGAWLAMAVVEILCSLALILPARSKALSLAAPVAAAFIAAEMLVFSGLYLHSGAAGYGPVIYWLVVAAVCAFIAYGRLGIKVDARNDAVTA